MPDNKEKYAKLQEVIEKRKGERGAVMPCLQEAMNIFGYVPQDVQEMIADGLGVTLSEVYGVSTFYSQFSLKPKGEHVIGVCLGTACYVKLEMNESIHKRQNGPHINTGLHFIEIFSECCCC